MTCRTVNLGGFTAIVCTREKRKRCHVCDRPAAKLCDFPLRGRKQGQTCSRPMCSRHAFSRGERDGDTIDYCQVHHLHVEQLELDLAKEG